MSKRWNLAWEDVDQKQEGKSGMLEEHLFEWILKDLVSVAELIEGVNVPSEKSFAMCVREENGFSNVAAIFRQDKYIHFKSLKVTFLLFDNNHANWSGSGTFVSATVAFSTNPWIEKEILHSLTWWQCLDVDGRDER